MSEQTEYAGFEASEFAENPEPRVACVLARYVGLDGYGRCERRVGTGQTVQIDGGMYEVVTGGTTRMDLLNEGLRTLKETLASDSLASKRAEIAIVTFGGIVTVVQDFVTAENFQPPHLKATGGTPMGQAISTEPDGRAAQSHLPHQRRLLLPPVGASHHRRRPDRRVAVGGGTSQSRAKPRRSRSRSSLSGLKDRTLAFYGPDRNAGHRSS